MYSNAAKAEMLGVPQSVLDVRGAVSRETAEAMAQGALAHARADLSVAITGIAGPGGGTPGKPVGTVCFAFACGRSLRSETRRFRGSRQAVRRQSVLHALRGALKALDAA